MKPTETIQIQTSSRCCQRHAEAVKTCFGNMLCFTKSENAVVTDTKQGTLDIATYSFFFRMLLQNPSYYDMEVGMNPAMMVGEVVINDLVEEGFLKVTGGLEFPVASQSTQRKLPVASQSLHGDTINWVPAPGGGQGEPLAVGSLVRPGTGELQLGTFQASMGKWRKVASGNGTRTSRRSWDTHLTQIHSKLVNLMNMTLPTKLKKVTGNKTFATKSAPDEENHRQVDTTTMVISKTVLDLTPSFDPCEGSAKGNNGSDMESSVQWELIRTKVFKMTAVGGSEETLVVGFKMDRVERASLDKLVVLEEDLGKYKSVEEVNMLGDDAGPTSFVGGVFQYNCCLSASNGWNLQDRTQHMPNHILFVALAD